MCFLDNERAPFLFLLKNKKKEMLKINAEPDKILLFIFNIYSQN